MKRIKNYLTSLFSLIASLLIFWLFIEPTLTISFFINFTMLLSFFLLIKNAQDFKELIEDYLKDGKIKSQLKYDSHLLFKHNFNIFAVTFFASFIMLLFNIGMNKNNPTALKLIDLQTYIGCCLLLLSTIVFITSSVKFYIWKRKLKSFIEHALEKQEKQENK